METFGCLLKIRNWEKQKNDISSQLFFSFSEVNFRVQK